VICVSTSSAGLGKDGNEGIYCPFLYPLQAFVCVLSLLLRDVHIFAVGGFTNNDDECGLAITLMIHWIAVWFGVAVYYLNSPMCLESERESFPHISFQNSQLMVLCDV
jgi:hypothetical protein